MGDDKRVTTYLASTSDQPSFPSSRPPSIISLNRDFAPLRPGGKAGPLLRGPRRVVRLCVFALLVPAVLITIPLYVRLVLYPPASYPMMPTDQRVISRHVSSLWCQAQTTHMNGTFTGYLSHGSLGTQPHRRIHVMLNQLKLQDDIKEYWGFYLLKGSTVTISSCAKWDGGQLMILRGIENLRRCAWIGEKDSSEDMDEDDDFLSNERHRQEERERQRHNGPKILSPTKPVEESREGIHMGFGIGNRGAGRKYLQRDLQADTRHKGSLLRGDTVNEGEVLEGGISKGSLHGGDTVNTRIDKDNLEESLQAGEEWLMQGSIDDDDDDDDMRRVEGNRDPVTIINSEERRQGITELLRQAISMSRDKKEILRILHSEGRSGVGVGPKNTLLKLQSSPNRRVTAVFSEPRPVQHQSLQKNESDDKVTDDTGGNTESNREYSNTHESIGRNISITNFTDTDFGASKTINITKPSESIVNNTTANRTTTIPDTDIRTDTPHTTSDHRQGNGEGRKSRNLKGETRRARLRKQNKPRRKKGTRRREENLTEEEDVLNYREQRRQRRDLQQLKQQQERHVEYEYEEVNEDDNGAFEVLDTEEELLSIMSETTTTTTKGKQTHKDKKRPTVENTVGGQIFFPEGLKFERGKFNQTTANDNSREEHVSSYSSSEEALASCEGVIMTLPLISFRGCSFHNALAINRIVYDIPITGTYYFVFSSDNEIYDNDLYFNLTMERVVYNVSKEEALCTNATHCTMPLHLWSSEQTVVEVPQEAGWDNAYVLNTKCEPRVYVYLTLLLLVPLLIMCCAFH